MDYWVQVTLATGVLFAIVAVLFGVALRLRRRAAALPEVLPEPLTLAPVPLRAVRTDDYLLPEDLVPLQQQVAQLRQELEAMRQALAAREAGATTLPGYNDAITLARSGASAQQVSSRCGISRAEAELIVSLHGNQTAH